MGGGGDGGRSGLILVVVVVVVVGGGGGGGDATAAANHGEGDCGGGCSLTLFCIAIVSAPHASPSASFRYV